MELITATEFLAQDEKVQKTFIDWWKPSVGDIFSTKETNDEIDVVTGINETTNAIFSLNDTFKYSSWTNVNKALEPFPLLTEQQLREFILDKTGCRFIEVFANIDNQEFQACLYDSMTSVVATYDYSHLGDDMFRAYWKVALKLINEDVK